MTLRVAVVTPRYPPKLVGGGETSARLLASQLGGDERVDEVVVYCFDGEGSESLDGLEVNRLGSPSPFLTEYQNVIAYRRLRDVLRPYDVVHGYNMELNPAVGYLSDAQGFASVATLNSYHFFPKSVTNVTPGRLECLYELVGHPTTGRLMLSLMRRIDAFVALSESTRDVYRSRGFEASRIELVPNMIDPSFEVPDAPREGSGYTLLYVGSLTANKGVRYLVEAMADLPDDVRLRVAGDGELRSTLQRLAMDRSVDDRVEFLGWVDYERVGTLYASADLFVHPGVWPEPMNRTVLEAMQAGLPVVCTDIGGPPEVMQHYELLCPPGDANVLAGAIERALERNLEELGESNREYVYDYHSPDVIVPQIVDVYQDLLQESP